MQIFTRQVVIVTLMLCSAFAKASPPNWQVEPNINFYQNTMSVVAVLNIQGVESTDANDMVAVFAGATCRGVGHADIVLSRNYVFLTIYSNASSNEALTFQIYDASADIVYYAAPDTVFVNNGTYGTINDPFVIYTSSPTGLNENALNTAVVFPNPFTENVNIAFDGAKGKKSIAISNLSGQLIYSAETEADKFTWNGNDKGLQSISAGLYILNINYNNTTKTYPIIKNPL